MCSIEELEGEPLFKLKVVEKGYEDLILTGPTPKGMTSDPALCHLPPRCPVTVCVCVCVCVCVNTAA